ncbi:MAG: ZIP family metal transporter [Chloroflexi bacterium]|nr:ZIP family metal transporter [Chloroflexota bacterium]
MYLALVFGLLTMAANMVGSGLAVARSAPHLPMANVLIGLSGGFILAVAILEIIPEALEGGAFIPPFIVAGYLLMYVIEQYFAAHAHAPRAGVTPLPVSGVGDGDFEQEHALHTEFRHQPRPITPQAAMAAFAGFLVHDFLDGLAIGAGLLADTSVGVLVFLGVMLHEIPAGLSVATLMRGAGNSRRKSFLAGVAIGAITIPGILLPFMFGTVDGRVTYVLLAMAAGTFLYLATTILIPAAGAEHSRPVVFSVVVGAALFGGTSFLVRGVLG